MTTPPPDPAVPRRVLLVDDQADLRTAMARYLTFRGFSVTEAKDGRTAIAAVEAGPPFRILLTDLSLPDIDGRELARSIRETSPSIWTAIVTGWPLESSECRAGGIDHVFTKPVDLAKLCDTLAQKSGPATKDPAPR